jgi:2-desacetyl-2-hydroxyethyl bacteriochlorophyllide A dehydrogenase
MKAINSFGPKDVRVVDVPDPAPGAGQVLVAVRASGICGSDKWLWRAAEPSKQVHGHEVAGQVVALGPAVRRLRVGDRVAINNVVGCGTCPACRAGVFVMCPNWTDDEDVNGGFGERVVAPERNCMKLADGIDYETGCLLFDNWGTPFGALERARVTGGDDVVVMGCGPIGLAAVGLAKLRGAFVVAVDPQPSRLEVAAGLGADVTLAPGDDTAATVRQRTSGLGARVVVECSGKPPAYPIGLAALRIGGVLVTVGEGGALDLRPSEAVIRRHLSIVGSWYSSMAQGSQVQDLVLQGKIVPRVLVTHRGPLAEFPRIFQQVCETPDQVVKAVILNP